MTEGYTINNHTIPDGIDTDFLLLSIRETLLNAVEHGNNQNPDSYVEVSIYFSPMELRIDVSDEGAGFYLQEKLKESGVQDGLQIGKRGLSLIHASADNIEVICGTFSLIFKA